MSSSNRRFHIEIEVDNIDNPERMDAVVDAVKIAARQAVASLMFICGDNPKPQVIVWAEDFETGRSSVSLKEDD